MKESVGNPRVEVGTNREGQVDVDWRRHGYIVTCEVSLPEHRLGIPGSVAAGQSSGRQLS